MKNNKYKILVLSDLKKSVSTTLKSSVSLAKMIDAEIALFHVKKHIDIVDRDNQFTAMRTLNEEHNNTKKNMDALVNRFSKEYNVNIKSNYAFGKIKEEIQKQIKSYNPDIIVLGQRDTTPFKFIGDSITRFILKNFKGIIMIASNENALEPNEKMTLGVLNTSNKVFETEFTKDLITHTKTPVKSFRILNSQKEQSDVLSLNEEKMVEYVFDKNANSMTTLSSYLLKNNINLLCVDRAENETKTPLKEVVNKLNVSLLVSEA
ncbi:universal stress protein [Oceanihabitans sp. 2_MG-2023]|uniref:universal stress protein n=1 Tax=Oceanihabitans sp. 2_MG-2023 TaxID=3062661 RepID=UPI0026E1F59D|nr:universal stress protein [Oceanihabitans sp. 2_MG-2023]MDO6595723.1 universal stress protein [Oceanihabitans sp. 2_MG-2023]